MKDVPPPPQGRLARLWKAAELRHVPLRTIVVTVAVVAATYLAGKLIYRLRDIVLLIIVAGFVALLLNPIVVLLQRRVPRRGYAVAIVTLAALVVFAVLAYEFGNPLVNGITDLADQLPGYVASAQHGTGWIGHLATKYHIQAWVQKNAPKLVTYAESLSKPVLTVGKGALSLLIELFTIFVLVLLLLLEGPEDAHLDPRPDAAGPGRQGHPGSRRREPGGHRLHAGQLAHLAHRRHRGVRDPVRPRRAVPVPVGTVGRPGGLPAHDRRRAGRHPYGAVRARPQPHRGHRHRWSSSSSTPRSRTTC